MKEEVHEDRNGREGRIMKKGKLGPTGETEGQRRKEWEGVKGNGREVKQMKKGK